ncbi:MAG: phosphoribosylamine--glycine ligase [Bacteroidota bacterium]
MPESYSNPTEKINILVIGGGGREHALVWKLSQSPVCGELMITPGNGGTSQRARSLHLSALNFEGIAAACLAENVKLVVVGPEAPLDAGIADYFADSPELQHIAVIGPKKAGAKLESSKDFSKAFMLRHGIPTAAARSFGTETIAEALRYVRQHTLPAVIKADGLAAGKGVIIAQTTAEAETAVQDMLGNNLFGEAGHTVVIEEFLTGIEMSLFVLTDGKDYVILPEAKDYKRIGAGDTGLNTGGMGAVSPLPFMDEALRAKIENQIVKPTISGLQKDGIPFLGFLFIGLMISGEEPFVIEYNVRLGDPETEAVLPRLEADLPGLFMAAAHGRLSEFEIGESAMYAATVVLSAAGYPGNYPLGDLVTGIADAEAMPDTYVFHAGTRLTDDGQLLTAGGRVIVVTALRPDPRRAMKAAKKAAESIKWKGRYFRHDIGNDVFGDN